MKKIIAGVCTNLLITSFALAENRLEVIDITKEYDLYLKENWVHYYPIKTENTSSLHPNTKKELINMVVEKKNRRTQILNK